MDQNLYNKLIVSLLFKGEDKKNATHKLSSIKISTNTIKVVYVDQFTKERDAVITTAAKYKNFLSWHRSLINGRFCTNITFRKPNNFDTYLKLFNSNMCEIIPVIVKNNICVFTDYNPEVISRLLLYVQPQINKTMQYNINEIEMIEIMELNFINDMETEGQYSSELTDLSCFEF